MGTYGQPDLSGLAWLWLAEVQQNGNSGWSMTSDEHGCAGWEEGIATFLADSTLYGHTAVTPTSCLSSGACSNTSSTNIETSSGSSCAAGQAGWPLNQMRMFWDVCRCEYTVWSLGEPGVVGYGRATGWSPARGGVLSEDLERQLAEDLSYEDWNAHSGMYYGRDPLRPIPEFVLYAGLAPIRCQFCSSAPLPLSNLAQTLRGRSQDVLDRRPGCGRFERQSMEYRRSENAVPPP